MGRLRLQGIRVFCRVGHTEAERDTGHHVEVDLELALDLQRAGSEDAMEHTVNYAALHGAVVEALEEARFHLLEAAAEAAAGAVVEALGSSGKRELVEELLVRVRKLQPPVPGGLVDHAEVEIRRVP